MSLIFGSVCSGIEAASAAWHPLGWRAAFLSEIEPFPRAVLAHHWPETPLHGDFTTIQDGDYEPIDLLVGGTPCQSFSVAGLRGGLDDDRGNLALEYLRLADRLRPRWLVWENVPGVLSSNGGRDFGSILGGMGELGYGVAYRVLDAQFFGLAQRRRRVFVVGYLGDWRRAAAVLFERDGLSGNLAPRREAGERPAPTISARPSGGGWLGTDFDCDGGLIAGSLGLRSADHPSGLKNESDFLVPMSYRTAGDGAVYEEGDCAAPLTTGTDSSASIIAFGSKEHAQDAGDVAPPLRAMGSNKEHPNGGGQVAIAYSIMPQNSGKDYKARAVEVAQPVMAAGPAGGNQGGDYVVHAIQAGALRENPDSGPDGVGVQADHAYTLEARAQEAWRPAHREDQPARLISAVRRLTPVECARLQGFPDNYLTSVPWKGKPSPPDGPMYKALGNSMAVPCMAWIGRRIQAVEAIMTPSHTFPDKAESRGVAG